MISFRSLVWLVMMVFYKTWEKGDTRIIRLHVRISADGPWEINIERLAVRRFSLDDSSDSLWRHSTKYGKSWFTRKYELMYTCLQTGYETKPWEVGPYLLSFRWFVWLVMMHYTKHGKFTEKYDFMYAWLQAGHVRLALNGFQWHVLL